MSQAQAVALLVAAVCAFAALIPAAWELEHRVRVRKIEKRRERAKGFLR